MEKKTRQVAIVHYNTPELTEAAILSLRKHGGEDYNVTVFDNSDIRPFIKKMEGVQVIDNTQGQIIDFDKELEQFPHRFGTFNNFGSDKHMMSIEKLFDILPDGFLLMDSDVLICQSVDFMFDYPDHCVVGHVQEPQPGNRFGIGRLVPMLCYLNVPKIKECGLKYFDPEKAWMLFEGEKENRNNWYDTGAAFLEQIRAHKNGARGLRIDIRPLMLHLKSASWRNNDLYTAIEWLMANRQLWQPEQWVRPDTDKIALVAIGRLENKYAKEFVQHHLALGFDGILIYDNNHKGEEHFEKVLKAEIDKGQVEIVDWRDREHQQNSAYRDAYYRIGQHCQWIAFFDFDELLQIEGGQSIKDVLKGKKADVVTVNWQNYGDSGLVKTSTKKMAERFTVPCDPSVTVKDPTHPDNYHVKSIVRGGLPFAVWRNPHCPIVAGTYETIEGKPSRLSPFHTPDYSMARLRHYVTKTIEEWMKLKVRRGEGCSPRNTEKLRQNPEEMFFKYNERTAEKDAWLEKFHSKPEAQKRTNNKKK